MLDELDAFGPSGLSTIFALPTRYVSMLRVIAISNDLAQSTSFTHRPSLTLAFAAYSAADMQSIIRGRLSGLAAKDDSDALALLIHPPALTLLVKKAAVHTGDIRYALEVLRRALDLASEDEATKADCGGQVGMKHVLDALKKSSHASRASATGTASGRSPLDGCINSLGLQARLTLIAVLLSLRRTSHNLSLEDISLSSVAANPFVTPKSKSKSPRSAAQLSSDSLASPSRVYSMYTQMLSTSSSKFDPVSRSEFSDLLGVLETSSLISLPVTELTSPSKRGRRASGFAGLVGGAGQGDISLCVVEDEVLRAILANSGEGNVLEQEVGAIWEREMKRIEQSLRKRGQLWEEEKLVPEGYL